MTTPDHPPSDRQPLTHFDESGASRMVDVGHKAITQRTAIARGQIRMRPETLARIEQQGFKKGDVFEVARLAGIMAAKKTSDLIPLCHVLPLESAKIDFTVLDQQTVQITSTMKVTAKTGVEMEALTAVSVTALTIYDMCKAVDQGMTIGPIELVSKTGGQSGAYNK